MFASNSQIICTIFGIDIYFYGVILAFAMVIGTVVSEYIARKIWQLKKDIIFDLAPYLIIFGIIGARIYYCVLNFGFYAKFPTEIFAIRHGGISIHGAIIGGLIGLLIFALKYKQNPVKLMDITVIGLSLAQAAGRWGNFFNSEAFGYPTNLPWKLYIAPKFRPVPFENYEYFHPTFLYESILDLIMFIILFKLADTKFAKKSGNLALLYLIMYSFIRIFVENYRIDSVKYINGIPIAILVSVIIIVVAISIFIYRNYISKKELG